MINTITVITNDYSMLQARSINSKDDIIVSFSIDSISALEKLTLNTFHNSSLLDNKNIYFSIYIDFKNSGKDSNSTVESILNNGDSLLQYFFHPKYKLLEGKPILCFNRDDGEHPKVKELISSFELLLINQGYQGVKPLYFAEKNNNLKQDSNICFTNEQSPNDITDTYFELLNSQYYNSKYVGIKSNKIEEVLQAITESENKLLKENPNQYYHLEKLNQLEKYSLALGEELRLAKIDLANQKTYLAFFRNNDEALKINQFYYYEYEVLPLWYKKIGHLIKVLSGKRTFRSLFDNDAEKYKK